jgi:hypothetical protein
MAVQPMEVSSTAVEQSYDAMSHGGAAMIE